MTTSDSEKHLPNYIRIHRRRAGLSQEELGELLGFRVESVARHEQFQTAPNIRIAIGYEIIFRIPISELFAGVRDDVATNVEANLAQLEERLGRRGASGRDANDTARKLMWLAKRKDGHCRSLP